MAGKRMYQAIARRGFHCCLMRSCSCRDSVVLIRRGKTPKHASAAAAKLDELGGRLARGVQQHGWSRRQRPCSMMSRSQCVQKALGAAETGSAWWTQCWHAASVRGPHLSKSRPMLKGPIFLPRGPFTKPCSQPRL